MTKSQDIALSIMSRAQGLVRCLEMYRNQLRMDGPDDLVSGMEAIKELLDADWRNFRNARATEAAFYADADDDA